MTEVHILEISLKQDTILRCSLWLPGALSTAGPPVPQHPSSSLIPVIIAIMTYIKDAGNGKFITTLLGQINSSQARALERPTTEPGVVEQANQLYLGTWGTGNNIHPGLSWSHQ